MPAAIIAARLGHVETLRALVGLGFPVTEKNRHGCNAAFAAAQFGHVEALRALAALGCPPAEKDDEGRNAAFAAATGGHVPVLRALAKLGCPTAEKANVALILEQRADMRGWLVQAALADKLPWGQARLAGFAPATAVDLDDLDDPVPE